MDDVAKAAMHRPGFFGRPLFDFGQQVLRGPSYWTPGEREYMAVFSSRLNECPFCVRVHTEVARIESRGEVDTDRNGPVRPELTAVLTLLDKVSRTPDDVSPEDVNEVRAGGGPDDAKLRASHRLDGPAGAVSDLPIWRIDDSPGLRQSLPYLRVRKIRATW
jgi:AhpD family alkylhydroperoxidase